MTQHSFGGNLQFENNITKREKKKACSVVIFNVPVIRKVRNIKNTQTTLVVCKIIYLFIRMSQNHLGGLSPSLGNSCLLYFR